VVAGGGAVVDDAIYWTPNGPARGHPPIVPSAYYR